MRPDISEFSYGYALTSELVRLHGLRGVGAPVFPSLIAEGKVGYDVRIPGIPLFLQFKLSDPMVRETARESHLLAVPYYRMHLRPLRHSDQHDLLRALEAKGNAVYYACPEFDDPSGLNAAYDKNRVVQESAFWSPNAVGPLPDDGDHYIAFSAGKTFGYVCSEPKKIDRQSSESIASIRQRVGQSGLEPAAPSPEYWRSVSGELLEIYAERRGANAEETERLRQTSERRNPVDYAVLLANMLFGCAILFAPGP